MPRGTRNSLETASFPVAGGSSTSSPSSTNGPVTLSQEVMEVIQAAASAAAVAAVRSANSGSQNPVLDSATSVAAPLPNNMASNVSAVCASSSTRSTEINASAGPSAGMFVPSFVNTVSPVASSSSSGVGLAMPGTPPISDSSVLNVPMVDQPFIIGPGFTPVPYKLVSQIVAGKYVDLSDLMAANLQERDNDPEIFLDGRLIVNASNQRKNRRRIEDIVSWLEAFSVYALVLTSYFPQRWRDLSLYKLQILRTYSQLSGLVWLNYDKAFREHAAAAKITDWSSVNVQLFNYHAAGASSRSSVSLETLSEPIGSKSATQCCISWNQGKCSSPRASCRYAHRCKRCNGAHRMVDCHSKPTRDRSRSPARRVTSSNKSGR